MKNKDILYDNRLVRKPWGYEYVVYRDRNTLCVTLLSINHNQTTSLHCHPNKKWIYFIKRESIISIRVMEKKI